MEKRISQELTEIWMNQKVRQEWNCTDEDYDLGSYETDLITVFESVDTIAIKTAEADYGQVETVIKEMAEKYLVLSGTRFKVSVNFAGLNVVSIKPLRSDDTFRLYTVLEDAVEELNIDDYKYSSTEKRQKAVDSALDAKIDRMVGK